MIKIKNLGFGIAAWGMALTMGCSEQAEIASTPEKSNNLYEGVEFNMPQVAEPSFPDNAVSIVDFGAKGDGAFDNTDAFKKAIDDVAQKGGGKVVVPRGIWLTGPIVLKSNINLEVQDGALITFSKNFDQYPLIATSFEGLETYRCISPIYGKDLENIAITGNGVIDGSGDAWRPVKKSKLTSSHWKKLVKSGGVVNEKGSIWYPSEKSLRGHSSGNFNVPDLTSLQQHEAVKDFLRPVMVSLINCKKVLLDGSTFQNSPAWNLHPLMCEDVTIRNLTIRNPWYSQNGDGLDLESCKNVVIHDNSFDVGDDAICFKSGKDEDGLKRGVPTENVIVKNNIVYHGHGGFTVGSEMSGGVKNVHVSNCTFIGTDCGLRFKSTRGRGGVVENIFISKIDMINIGAEAIRFNLYYGGESPIGDDGSVGKEMEGREKVEVSRTTPSFRDIYITDVNSTGSGVAAFFQGLPEMKLKNIQLKNVFLEGKKGVTLIDANDISFENVQIAQSSGPALTVFNTNKLDISNLAVRPSEDKTINVYGTETDAITFKDSKISQASVFIAEEVKESSVVFD